MTNSGNLLNLSQYLLHFPSSYSILLSNVFCTILEKISDQLQKEFLGHFKFLISDMNIDLGIFLGSNTKLFQTEKRHFILYSHLVEDVVVLGQIPSCLSEGCQLNIIRSKRHG